MQKVSAVLFIVSVLLSAGTMWSQTSDDQTATENVQQPQSPASGTAPAGGQAPSLTSDFPPLSGLDEGILEPNVAARSFLLFGAQVGEMATTNASNNLNGGTSITGVTHLLGSAALQRFWSRYQTALSYVGGAAFYGGGVRRHNAQIHSLNFDWRVLWRTGSLTFRDRASYMPDGIFGGGFGGAGGAIGGLGGLGGLGSGLGAGIVGGGGNRLGFFGQGLTGTLGNIPTLTNLSMVDLQQALSPRSTITMAGGFNFIHFTKATNGLLIDSQQVTGQAGYDYSINRRNKLAIFYGYQHFHFPQAGGGGFETHVVNLLYGHQISGRWSLTLGAGPQITNFASPAFGKTLRLSASGRASLHYRFPKAGVSLNYAHLTTAGGGFFAGSTTDLVEASATRPLSRRWDLGGNLGYQRSKRLQTITLGVPTGSYQRGFVGARLTHLFTRDTQGFLTYQFSDLVFDSSFCATPGTCGRISKLQVVTIGVNWHSRPHRLD